MKSQWLAALLLTFCTVTAMAQRQPNDPLQKLLVSPDRLLRHRAELALSDDQVERIRRVMESAGPKSRELQQRANASRNRLAELLAQEGADADATLEQLDAFLSAERELKRHHLQAMIKIRNELTPAQRQTALGITAPRQGNLPNRNNTPPRPIDSTLTAEGLSDAEAQAAFYQSDEVQTIQLTIAPNDLRRMQAALPERIVVPGSIQWRDVKFDGVGVRYKGNSSANPHQRHKRSFLVKFNEYEAGARFFGLRRVSFDNGVQFGSLFSEPIVTGILSDLGLPTHRCNYARIFLNGQYQGVYVNVERIDKSFLEQHWADPNGALLKADVGGPGGNLQFVGDDPTTYERALEPKSKSAKENYAQLVDFLRVINQTEPSKSASTLETAVELDDFLRVSAVMLFSGAFDQLTGGAPHNYYLYHNTKTDRWRYLPWDLDVGFCETAFGRIQVLNEWHAGWPLPPSGGPNPLMERIVADPALLKRYRQTARTILDKYFEPEQLSAILDANYELIKADLQADPFPHQRVTVPGDRGYDEIVESMKTFMRKRYSSAVAQLENPGPRPEPRRSSGLPPQLAEKVRRIEQRAGEMQARGEPIAPVQALMHRVPPLLQQGKMDDASAVLDEALELVDGKRDESPSR